MLWWHGLTVYGKTGPMEHWVYGTDDDEPPNKECSWCDDASKQHHAELKRTCAESSKPDTSDDAAVTNAPGDPSWARLEPHPENARPPPQMDPPNLQFTFAPEKVEWTPETADEDESYQDPRLPPGVIESRRSCGGVTASDSVKANGQNNCSCQKWIVQRRPNEVARTPKRAAALVRRPRGNHEEL